MFIDSQLVFDNGAAITAGGASTNSIDLSVARGLGSTEPLTLSVMCASTFTAAGAATLTIEYQTSPDNATWTTDAQTGAIPLADLTEGQQLATFDIPHNTPVGVPQRYVRLNYLVGTGPFRAGSVNSSIVSGKQVYTGYPPGYTFVAPAVQTFVAG